MLSITKNLFEAWNIEDILYCHWKSNEHLEEGLNGDTDLDVYVAPIDKNRAENLLVKDKFIKFVPQKSAVYPMVDEWIGFDYDTGKLVHVHLHYQIITGTKYNKEYVFPIDELIMKTRTMDTDYSVYVTARELEIIILYSRICLKAENKRNISPNKDYVKEIIYLKQRLDWKTLNNLCGQLFNKSAQVVFNSIKKETLNTTEWFALYKIIESWLRTNRKTGKIFTSCKYNYHKYRNLYNAVVNKYLEAHRVTRKILKSGGISVCFLGADGCGKSTVSQEICRWLNWKIEADRFYLGSGDHYEGMLKKFLNHGRQASDLLKEKKEKIPASVGKEKKQKQSTIIFVLKYVYDILMAINLKNISKNAYKQLKKANIYMKNGGIALFDRFPQNQFAGLYDGPKIRSRMCSSSNSLFMNILADREEKYIEKAQGMQPDVVIKLLLPPEESIRRKPDHTLQEVAPKAEITPQLIFANSAVYDIDATQDYQAEILEIKRIIWGEILKHDYRI